MAWKFFKIPFASSGDTTSIPDTDASLTNMTNGFPAAYSLPNSNAGRKMVERTKLNWLLNKITEVLNQYQIYGVPEFITSSDNGGTAFSYSKGARVRYDPGSGKVVYISKENSNTSLPTDTSKWILDTNYLVASNNLSDLSSVSTALTNLGFDQLASAPGYVKLPGGIIIQWGSATLVLNDVPTAITLPTPFTTAAYAGIASISGTSFMSGHTAGVTAISTTQITIMCTTSGKVLNWIAIGK